MFFSIFSIGLVFFTPETCYGSKMYLVEICRLISNINMV